MDLAAVSRQVIKKSNDRIGMLDLNTLLLEAGADEVTGLGSRLGFGDAMETASTVEGKVAALYEGLLDAYPNAPKGMYGDPLEFITEKVLKDPRAYKIATTLYDIISKQDLMEVFADYCADYGIAVFNSRGVLDYDIDLFLTKKDPLLKTEAVFVRTGVDLKAGYGQDFVKRVAGAGLVSDWILLVTTPMGVVNVGFDRLLLDVENLNVWFYVVDPLDKRILGITKGKKQKKKTETLQEAFIQALPSQPTRAPSQVKKFSTYAFNERNSYKAKYFRLATMSQDRVSAEKLPASPRKTALFQDIFRQIIFIDVETGISLFSYTSEQYKVDDLLVSGFLTAIDNFVSEISDATALKEINYEGFFINSVAGNLVRAVLFLSKPATESLKERLLYLVRAFENTFAKDIQQSTNTGRVAFNTEEVNAMVRDVLSV